jgi:hypothetical protein
VLAHGRSASSNWFCTNDGTMWPRPNRYAPFLKRTIFMENTISFSHCFFHNHRAHSVLRAHIWRQSRGQHCTLHIVDTVGSQSGSSHAHSSYHAHDNERKQASAHLLALSRTISELAQGHASGSSSAPPRPYSARDCRISELVGACH